MKKPDCNCFRSEAHTKARDAEVNQIGELVMEIFCEMYEASALCAKAASYAASAALVGVLYEAARIDQASPEVERMSKEEAGLLVHARMTSMVDEVVQMTRERLQEIKTRNFTSGNA